MIQIRQTLAAKVIRQVTAVPLTEARADTVKKLQERYHFMKAPITFEELFPSDPTEGIKFLQGSMAREGKPPIVVEMLQLLPNLIIVETRTSTDDAEEVLGDYLNHANKDRPDTVRVFGPPLYSSEVEFSSDIDLTHYAPQLAATVRQLDSLVSSYGAKAPPYQVVSIIVNFDMHNLEGAVPGFFRIERRSGVPFGENLFYSVAPLKTQDHHEVLRALRR